MSVRHIGVALLAATFLCTPVLLVAQSVEDLQREIDQNSAKIETLNKEIAQYEAQLATTTNQKKTLQNKIAQLDLERKKLTASINVTRNRISTTQAQIQQLAHGIASKQSSIEGDRAGLQESLRRLDQAESRPLALSVLSSESFTDAWQDIDAVASIQDAVRADMQRLTSEKASLTASKLSAESKQAELLKQQRTLATQQGSLEATRKSQSEILAETKSKESAYQAILAQKQAEKVAFEAALFELASKLEYTLDPSKVPSAGKGVLRWPLDSVTITQQFGRTSDSRRLYVSGTHDGIDFSTKTAANQTGIGTPVKAALTGTVVEINLGSVPNCQYGKWVLVRHGNGLTTLYAHLSAINVTKGQTVSTGSILGYSGDTGYATGPHLHFTVYASDAVTFKTYACRSGRGTLIPIANPSAYLNPLDYL